MRRENIYRPRGELVLGPRSVVQFRADPEPLPNRTMRLSLHSHYELVVRVDTVDVTGLASGEVVSRRRLAHSPAENRLRRRLVRRTARLAQELLTRGVERMGRERVGRERTAT